MKVLVADDDPICQLELVDALADWGYEVVTAVDGATAWEMLNRDDAPQMAIVDWLMPGMDGVQLCRHLRAMKRPNYVYVIVLTARARSEDVVAAIDAGADDFVSKPCDERELEVRLRAGRRFLELQEALRFKASHDPLTGVWNHGVILELFERELSRGARENTFTGVLMADLDRFKSINDDLGHPAGDAVLREAVRRMTESLRAHDLLGRYGGEEFLMVLPGTTRHGALEAAERVREALSATPMRVGERIVPVTVSLGVAVALPTDPVAAAALVRAADEALYRAKREGRNRCVLADLPEQAASRAV